MALEGHNIPTKNTCMDGCTGVDALAEGVRESLGNVLNIVVDGEREESNRDDSQYGIVRCGVFRKRPACFTKGKDSVASCLL